MKIGLINQKYKYKEDPSILGFCYINGISCISSILKKEGYDVKIVDFVNDETASLNSIKDCSIIGLTSYIDSYNFFKETLPILKNQKRKIIVGGPLISSYGLIFNNLLMKKFPEIDFGIIGEGEKAISGLIKKLEEPALSLPGGIIYRDDGKLKTTGKPEIFTRLDDLPEIDYYDWDGLTNKAKGGIFMVSTSRGCYNACSFCFKIFPGVRSFSLDRIAKELEKIVELNPKSIFFVDDTFTYDKKRAIEIGKLSKRVGLKYGIQTRVKDVTFELMESLKSTGCESVRFGIESFDDRILRKCGKNISKNQAYNAIDITQKAGILAFGYFIVGLPGEDKKSLETTLKGIEETKVIPRSGFLVPLPGTDIYNNALENGLINEERLLKSFSKYGGDTHDGNWVPINLTKDLSDNELIQARDKILELRRKMENKKI